MRKLFLSLSLAVAASALPLQFAFAQAPAGAPAGSTAQCNDNTYFSGATKRGACAGHKGVKSWYGGTAATTAPAPGAAMAASPAMPSKTDGMAKTPAAVTPDKNMGMAAPATKAAAGGLPGQVWVNSSTKVYHCPSDRYYGKTKAGAYMSEAEAQQKGFHPDHGKACK